MSKTAKHWARQQERGNYFFLKLTAWLAKYIPTYLLWLPVCVVVFYFYITSARERKYIQYYQQRLQISFPQVRLPERMPVFWQFMAFGNAIIDRFRVWQNKIHYRDLILEDADHLYHDIRHSAKYQEKGQILVCTHIGNVEVCRALVGHHHQFKLNILVYSAHARIFNQTLKEAGASDIHLIQVYDLDAALMLDLQKRLHRGEWIAIAADRIPVRGEKTVAVPFLGKEALLPQGPWLLAGLLKAPVNTLFCSKINGSYRLHLSRLTTEVCWQKNNRSEVVREYARQFADCMAQECAVAPLQWFNFYDFWNDRNDQNTILSLSD